MKVEGVLFDLDGTLVNSLDDIADSMNSVLRQHHFPVHPNEDYKLFIGNGLRNLVRTVLPEAYRTDEELVGKCLASMIELYNANCLNKTKPYAGISSSLMQQYKTGNTYVSEKQICKIEKTLHKIGHELASIKLI